MKTTRLAACGDRTSLPGVCFTSSGFSRLLILCVLLAPRPVNAADVQIHFVPPGMRFEDVTKIARPSAPAADDELSNAGDFYLRPDGSKIPLLRAKNSVAVSFSPGVSASRGMAKLKTAKGMSDHSEVSRAAFRDKEPLHILRARKKAEKLDAKSMQSDATVTYARQVLVDAKSRTRMIPTDEILARVPPGTSSAVIQSLAAQFGLRVVGPTRGKLDVYKLRMKNPKSGDPLQIANSLAATKAVLWAQPDFVREIRHFYTPPNELFGYQQALLNTGQNRGVAGADVNAVNAWNVTTGLSSIVIAIIDDGVDIAHPGLRIFTNPGETGDGKDTNGIDDDSNGLIDDVHGWDFADNDNSATPIGTNGHGTGTAGIAGATFGMQAKSAGIAGGCTILPVKIADDTGSFTTDQIIGDSILYAAGFADVLSNSWGGGSESSFINDSIDYAVTQGRQGRGCPVFFATGNSASTWYQGGGRWRLSTAGLSGNYYYSFYYEKGPTLAGEDTVRIDNVCLLDADGYTHKTPVLADEDFEGVFFPPLSGWWLAHGGAGNSSFWTVSSTNTLTGTGGSFSAVSPTLTDGQYAWLVTPLMAISGAETFAFASSISIPTDSSLLIPVYDASLAFIGYYGPFNAVPDFVDTDTTYPASHVNSIAVGASTDCDLRSDYSQYGGHLDFVVPSNGGWNDTATLDPVGLVGWTPYDFKMNFGGTSSATPLAAGVAALALSVNPSLTAAELRTLMQKTCDKIGGVTYDITGTNQFYGHGRVNAFKAVSSALPAINIQDVTVTESAPGTTGTADFVVSLSAPTIREVSIDYSTTDGTALAGTNYTASSGTIMIPSGATSGTISITINGGALTRPSGSFVLNLSNAANATISRAQAAGEILALDTDADSMPDYWENSHALNPAEPGDAAPDTDYDGFTNLQEFVTGTDPWDTNSSFKITRIRDIRDAGNDVAFTFPSALGRTYRVEYKEAIMDPDWTQLGNDIEGTGSSVEFTDTGILTSRFIRFYQVRLLQ